MNPLDPSDMHGMITNFPSQFQAGVSWAEHIQIDTSIKSVVVTGMGGSALPTDLVNLVFRDKLPQPITLNRSYTIEPHLLTPNTLVIACSFSGNTEETISAYNQAVAANIPTVALAGGGELIRLAESQGLSFVKLIKESPNFQPRMGSGYFFGCIAQVLNQIGWIDKEDLSLVLQETSTLEPSSLEALGQELAQAVGNKIPVFYTSDRYWPVARVSKIKINENAKTPAFWNYLPEANHNEMVGYTKPNGDYIIVNLIDPKEDERINKRFGIMSKLLEDKLSIPHFDYIMQGDTVFAKTFSTLIFADWASYYLALSKGIDPTPVDMVEDFKDLVVK